MDDRILHERIFDELKDIRSEIKDNTKVTSQGFKAMNGRVRKLELDNAVLKERSKLSRAPKLDAKIVGAMVAALGVLGYVITKLVEVFIK